MNIDTSNIRTVKLQDDGYLLNGSMSVPNDEGNRDYQDIQEWVAEGNTPEPEFTQAEAADRAQLVINADARAYLSSTDLYAIRFQETGVAIPQEIEDARTAARLVVI